MLLSNYLNKRNSGGHGLGKQSPRLSLFSLTNSGYFALSKDFLTKRTYFFDFQQAKSFPLQSELVVHYVDPC